MDWQPIHSAPVGQRVLVWWPMVALTELGGVTGQVVGGEMTISIRARGSWELAATSADAARRLVAGQYTKAMHPEGYFIASRSPWLEPDLVTIALFVDGRTL